MQCSFVMAGEKKGWRRARSHRCRHEATREIGGQPFCQHHHPWLANMHPHYQTTQWRALRQTVLERDGHVCQYCGGRALQADHVTPRSCGGKDVLSNLVACCTRCNELAGATHFNGFADKKRWLRLRVGGLAAMGVK